MDVSLRVINPYEMFKSSKIAMDILHCHYGKLRAVFSFILSCQATFYVYVFVAFSELFLLQMSSSLSIGAYEVVLEARIVEEENEDNSVKLGKICWSQNLIILQCL